MAHLTRILILSGLVALSNPLGTVSGQTNDLLTAEAGAQPAVLAVQAGNSFAIDFYKHLAKDESAGNLFFSPYSISTAMTMVQEGARGQTAQEIGNVLGFPKAARRTGPDSQLIPWQTSLIHTGLAEIDGRLVQHVDPQAQAQLITANALWVEKTYGLSPNYVNTLSQHYKTGGAFEVDFIGDAEAQRQRINQWVLQQTQGLIEDLLPEDSIDDQTRAVLTNTIYFKAVWPESFTKAITHKADFHLADGKKIQTLTMTQPKADWCRYGAFIAQGEVAPKGEFDLRQPGKDGFQVLEMPYKGETTSMLLIVPQDPAGLSRIESLLTPEAISQWAGQLEKETVSIYLPKFKMQAEYKLKEHLSQMGMSSAFAPGKADFTGMQASPGALCVGEVYHKTFLDVNEVGTTAAAATAVRMIEMSGGGLSFQANRPFLFMIRDNKSGTILFMGRVTDPSKLQ